MATRTIVTSHADVACDVCERRLLRGEQWDIFVVAGRRRTVCELCAPRAAHEGWRRESDTAAASLPPIRPRRGRSFLDRLRQVAKPEEGGAAADVLPVSAPAASDATSTETSPYNFLDSYAGAEASASDPSAGVAPVRAAVVQAEEIDESSWYLQRAVELFNKSEYPRRVAGVSRSLGAPEISVRAAEHLESVMLIVVAWELCWYRYEVDLSVEAAEAKVLAQGTELSELSREERLVNASAGESGELILASL